MLKRHLHDNPNLQLQLAYIFWLDTHCLRGHQFCATNYELLEDFGHCVTHYDLFDLFLEQEQMDTLLAHSGFHPNLEIGGITWYGVTPIAPYCVAENRCKLVWRFPDIFE